MTLPNFSTINGLPVEILDILPNPVLVKDAELRYVWINRAFEQLFSVTREALIGELDKDVFKERQVAQCNGGDLRVLRSGEIDEAYETVFRADSEPRETITRKSRLILPNGQVFLVGIMHDITDITHANRRLEENHELLCEQAEALARMANTDALTGCANRRAMYAYAESALSHYGNVASLFALDIDFFKRINDTYSHKAGDAALVHFAKIVEQNIRQTDKLVRLGGEEFAVILPGMTSDVAQLAERIREAVAMTPLLYQGQEIPMTVSIGVVQAWGDQPINLDAMLQAGDRYLYEAKNAGRNRVVCGK